MGRKKINIIGLEFGRWTVISYNFSDKRKKTYWLCRCSCGAEKTVRADSLTDGNSTSCGNCYSADYLIPFHNKHGLSRHKIFETWTHIKQRCYNKNNESYNDYGNRGITMCEEWRNDFVKFYNWCISNGYEKGLQIDRINNDGNYEPSNCRWATHKINMRNTRNTKLTEEKANEIREKHKLGVSSSDIANLYSVTTRTIYNIVNRETWV